MKDSLKKEKYHFGNFAANGPLWDGERNSKLAITNL
jgi:hypothetical protein